MMKSRTLICSTLRRLAVAFLSLSTLALPFFFLSPPSWAANGKVLKGIVRDGFIKPSDNGPSLSRKDINRVGDPFDQTGEEQFEPPPEAFNVQNARPQAPPNNMLQGNAADTGGFQGQGMPGMGDQMPVQQPPPMMPAMAPPTQLPQMNPNDPDNSQEMKLAWDEWHRRVAEGIFVKIQTIASVTLRRSPPLICKVCYTVTREGRVVNVRMLQPSSSIIYNTLVMTVINSMNGNPVLQFPMGSRRMMCEKTTTLAHNNGGPQGFRSITGDTETMQNRRR